jgi:hypothetical protein
LYRGNFKRLINDQNKLTSFFKNDILISLTSLAKA